jgi:hypothetical protein
MHATKHLKELQRRRDFLLTRIEKRRAAGEYPFSDVRELKALRFAIPILVTHVRKQQQRQERFGNPAADTVHVQAA